MRSLFLKIFLWIWIAMVLVSLTLVLSSMVQESHSSAQQDEEMDRTMTPMVAEHLSDIYDKEGAVAFANYLKHSEKIFPWRPFLLDRQGRDVLGRVLPPSALDVFRIAAEQRQPQIIHEGKTRWVAQSVVADSGRIYVLVLEILPHAPPSLLRAPSQVQVLRFAAIVLIVGLISLWLTRHITSPILRLRETANQLAEGRLSARVGEISPRRKDELADLYRDFDHMAEQVETLMDAQQRLLSDISHELRSPLARLSVALGLANRTATPESIPALARIEREAERLNELITGLLNLARMESGNRFYTRTDLDLEILLREIIADANFEADSRNRSVRLLTSFHCLVDGNTDLLGSAIENVIRNALNYTPEGTAVEVSLVEESSSKSALLVVRDHGPGVPEAALPTIFHPFYRVEESRDRVSGGTGLGLSITDRAVRGHSGTVAARNAVDGGLIIEIRLPLQSSLTNSPALTPTS